METLNQTLKMMVKRLISRMKSSLWLLMIQKVEKEIAVVKKRGVKRILK